MGYWSVVVTRPRSEKLAVENLQRQGYEHYLPLVQSVTVVKGKRVTDLVPMFPRYLFVRIEDHQGWWPLKSTRGINKILTLYSEPQRVADRVIEDLKNHEVEVPNVVSFWRKGDPVKIVSGAFAGLLGIYDCTTSAERMQVLVSILGRQSLVEVPVGAVESVPAPVR